MILLQSANASCREFVRKMQQVSPCPFCDHLIMTRATHLNLCRSNDHFCLTTVCAGNDYRFQLGSSISRKRCSYAMTFVASLPIGGRWPSDTEPSLLGKPGLLWNGLQPLGDTRDYPIFGLPFVKPLWGRVQVDVKFDPA